MFRAIPLAIVLQDNSSNESCDISIRSALLNFAGEALEHAEPCGDGDQLGKRLNTHLLHHLVAVSLDGAFGRSQSLRDLLVDLALNDKIEDLMLTRRQRFKQGAKGIQPMRGSAQALMMGHRSLDGAEDLF